MAEQPDFKIRPMTSDDLAPAFGLSRAEGWNQTELDWRFLLMNPNNICLVAEYNNKVAGTATALVHSMNLAWIGMVLVDREMRGRGIGKMLMVEIIRNLKKIESVKLDATPAGLPLYRKLGFIEECELHRMVNKSVSFKKFTEPDNCPVNIDSITFEEVLKLDKEIFGSSRSSLLNYLFQNYPEKAFHIIRSGKIDGYISGREGTRYSYIGPAVSFSAESGRLLIIKALKSLEGKPVALDVLHDKQDLITWLESAGFEKQRSFIRMYLKSNRYCGNLDHQYLISGPEFG